MFFSWKISRIHALMGMKPDKKLYCIFECFGNGISEYLTFVRIIVYRINAPRAYL